MSRTIDRTVTIDAPAEAVWRAITDADELVRWFAVEARVEPGPKGSIWISWGPGAEGGAPVSAWEPHRRFGWLEDRGTAKVAVDFHIEAAGGSTRVRLVQSGFGDSREWDDEFQMTDTGWAYFLAHLKFYLERHRGVPRGLVSFREPVSITRRDAFRRIAGRSGFGLDLARNKAGARYDTTTARGDRLSGSVVIANESTGQLAFTVDELNDAMVFLEIEPAESGVRPGLWISTYGLAAARLDDVRERFGRLYRDALKAPV
jgi:uncharacterized protein YndB with AHSA1/START domain